MPDGTSGSFTFLHVAESGGVGVPSLPFCTSDASRCCARPIPWAHVGACALCVHRLACCCLSIKTVVHWEKVGEGPNFCFCRPHRLSALCKCAPVIGLRAVEGRSVNRASCA